MMFGLRNSDLETICQVFSLFPEITEAILFGSRAKGTEKPGSDVDIALQGNGGSRIAHSVSTILNQESRLPYFFDIIDFSSIDNEALLDHIHRVGKSIYKKP